MTRKTNKPAAKAKATRADVPATVAPPVDKTRHLQVVRDPSKTEDRQFADVVADGLASNAATAIRFIKPDHGDVSLTELVASLRDQGEAVNRGDLAAAERMLSAQAVALNVVFSEMARVAQVNLFQAPEFADRCLRLALKAQSQSRATVETLATIKNPPVVFARQANINNGGQQQVNNGTAPLAESVQPPAHAGKTAYRPNELIENMTHGRTQLDTRATAAAGRTNPSLEPVGAINRPAKR